MLCLAVLALWLDRPAADDPFRTSLDPKADVTAGTIYSARFTDIEGNEQEMGQWQHRLLIINFWATWCAPCKEEMPLLTKMQEKFRTKGLQIVGIAVDSRQNVAKFSQNSPTGYPLLPDEVRAIEFSRRLGNRLGLLPFTVVVRPGGEVIFSHLGIITESQLLDLIVKNTKN
jgi:thiol-disulfide isomerase/thioredoxin